MFTKINDNKFLLLFAFSLFVLTIFINQQVEKTVIEISKQKTAVNINSNFIQLLSVGNKRFFSNLLWIQTLLESDQTHYVRDNDLNWMYLRFMTIAKLDPKFYENYLFGGMYLSIIKDDTLGAADLFELGLKYYSEDYGLNYYAGFNYYYELGDYKRGLTLLKKIEASPKAPMVLKFIIGKLQYETTNDFNTALAFLENNYLLAKDEKIKKKITSDIYSLRAQNDLDCLNSRKENCNTTDAFGVRYIKDLKGNWKSSINYKPYKIFRKK